MANKALPLLLLGGAALFALGGKKKGGSAAEGDIFEFVPDEDWGGAIHGSGGGNYVGSGWSWPHKNQFPSELTFGKRLMELGYSPGGLNPSFSVLSDRAVKQVKIFQNHWNIVASYLEKISAEKGVPVPVPRLSVDGKIGANTIEALIRAPKMAKTAGKSWGGLVGTAQAYLG